MNVNCTSFTGSANKWLVKQLGLERSIAKILNLDISDHLANFT